MLVYMEMEDFTDVKINVKDLEMGRLSRPTQPNHRSL